MVNGKKNQYNRIHASGPAAAASGQAFHRAKDWVKSGYYRQKSGKSISGPNFNYGLGKTLIKALRTPVRKAWDYEFLAGPSDFRTFNPKSLFTEAGDISGTMAEG